MDKKTEKVVFPEWLKDGLAVITAVFAIVQFLLEKYQLALVMIILAAAIFAMVRGWKMFRRRNQQPLIRRRRAKIGGLALMIIPAALLLILLLIPGPRAYVATALVGTPTPAPTPVATAAAQASAVAQPAAAAQAAEKATAPGLPSPTAPAPALSPTSTTGVTATAATAARPNPRPTILVPWGEPISAQNAGAVRQVGALDGYTRDLDWSPDARVLAAAQARGVNLYEAGSLTLLRTLAKDVDNPQVAFFFDSERLAVAGGGLVIWNANTGGQLIRFEGLTEVDGLSVSPDGAFLGMRSGQAVLLVDGYNGSLVRTIPVGSSQAAPVFSPDGKLLACAGGIAGQEIHLISVPGGEILRTLTGHTNWINELSFSPDGARLASASVDQTVKVWDPATGLLAYELVGHTDQVDGVAFSPDGALLASISWDLTIRLWEAESGRALQTLTGHTAWGREVIFSPDGGRLASRDISGKVLVWGLAP